MIMTTLKSLCTLLGARLFCCGQRARNATQARSERMIMTTLKSLCTLMGARLFCCGFLCLNKRQT